MTDDELAAESAELSQKWEDNTEPEHEDTDEFWEALAQKCEEHTAWLKTQKIGNTLLPDILHEYVQQKIESGHFRDATEVVMAALDRLPEYAGCRTRASAK